MKSRRLWSTSWSTKSVFVLDYYVTYFEIIGNNNADAIDRPNISKYKRRIDVVDTSCSIVLPVAVRSPLVALHLAMYNNTI